MKPGIYKIWGQFPDKAGTKLFQYGRILVTDTETYVVEDNRDFIMRMLPDGPLDDKKKKRLIQMMQSSYLRVEVDDPTQKLDSHYEGEAKAEAEFDLLDEEGVNHKLEVYPGDNIWLDGSRIDEKGVEFIFEQVRTGRYKLLPR